MSLCAEQTHVVSKRYTHVALKHRGNLSIALPLGHRTRKDPSLPHSQGRDSLGVERSLAFKRHNLLLHRANV